MIKKLDENEPSRTCYFQSNQTQWNESKQKYEIIPESMAVIPLTLNTLLSARSATKQRLKKESNEDKKKVLDGLQLSYKVVANSVYGQLGGKNSMIYKKDVAACTTCTGRNRIQNAIDGVYEWSKKMNFVNQLDIIYGDTDSVFIKFPNTYQKEYFNFN